ncbi:hypothetical protein [Embleya sp. AB8]|uniref:hypothetical protein n=1 Tax=Embleya sp. AB8 TaxID=3156304 RepID=UPI003C771323
MRRPRAGGKPRAGVVGEVGATMNRATAALAEWNERTAATGARTPGEARCDDELQSLRRVLSEVKRERTELQQRLDAAATVIAAIHHDNTALREELTDRGGSVIALGGRPPETMGPC